MTQHSIVMLGAIWWWWWMNVLFIHEFFNHEKKIWSSGVHYSTEVVVHTPFWQEALIVKLGIELFRIQENKTSILCPHPCRLLYWSRIQDSTNGMSLINTTTESSHRPLSSREIKDLFLHPYLIGWILFLFHVQIQVQMLSFSNNWARISCPCCTILRVGDMNETTLCIKSWPATYTKVKSKEFHHPHRKFCQKAYKLTAYRNRRWKKIKKIHLIPAAKLLIVRQTIWTP